MICDGVKDPSLWGVARQSGEPGMVINGQPRKAIAEAGRTGWVYILDRTNGKPLIGIEERPVP